MALVYVLLFCYFTCPYQSQRSLFSTTKGSYTIRMHVFLYTELATACYNKVKMVFLALRKIHKGTLFFALHT